MLVQAFFSMHLRLQLWWCRPHLQHYFNALGARRKRLNLPQPLCWRVIQAILAIPISGLIDDIDPATTAMDAKAAAMRAQLAEEQRIMDARDEVAIRRMAEVQAARQRELEAQKASGVPFCAENDPTKVLGDSGRTGVLTAKACQRVRTGLIETGPRTGALLIF